MGRKDKKLTDVKTEKFTISWDEGEKFIFIKFIGDQNDSDAKKYAAKLRKLIGVLKDRGEVVDKALVDLREAGTPSLGARMQYRKVTNEYTKGVENGKIAYVGADAFNEIVAKLIHSLSSFLVKIRYFANITDAKEWLKAAKDLSSN